MPPEPYLTCLTRKFTGLVEHPVLSDSAKLLLVWLVFSADPRNGVVPKVSITELTDVLGWSRTRVRRTLDELVEAGMVLTYLPNGVQAGGHIEVLPFYEVLAPTQWLAKMRAVGDKRVRDAARSELGPSPTCDALADAKLVRDASALAVANARRHADGLRGLGPA